MIVDLRDLMVKPGDPVLPAWRRLLDWAKQFRLYSSNQIRLTRTPQGTYIVAEVSRGSFDHPFRVSVTSGEAFVRPGTVEDIYARIGGVGADKTPAPKLPLGKPNAEGRSWVVVEVTVKDGVIDPEDKGAVVIRHASSLARTREEVGIQPLAMLVWSGSTVSEVHQIVHHSLGHYYVQPAEGRGGRHLFFAV